MFRKIVKFLIPTRLFRSVEPYGHLGESLLWNLLMRWPDRGLKVIGVTGTDGKTTTSTLIYTMLNEAGIKTGLMTTIGYGTPERWHDNQVHMTTMQTRQMLQRIKELRAAGIEWLVLETTSHALAQNRVWGVDYSMAVMTNITHEHLDYHGTFDRYKQAKLRLFRMTGDYRAGLRMGIINADDPVAAEFAAAVPRSISYGLQKGTLRPAALKMRADGSEFDISYERQSLHIRTSLPGEFNVYNTLATVGVGLAMSLSKEQIEAGIAALESVGGRMTRVDEGQKFAVIVDFAHTPASFEKVLNQVKQLTKGRLIVMFGSAGRRDEKKRAVQGEIAGRLADLVVITEEDDRDVDGMHIMEQIAGGVELSGKLLEKEVFMKHDRATAIRFTLGMAKKDDTVLLLGKGHEKTIERADGAHPWDEVAETHAALGELKVARK